MVRYGSNQTEDTLLWNRNAHTVMLRYLEVQYVRKVAVHLGYSTQIWLSVSKLLLKRAVVSQSSVVKQQMKCNTGKVCNCLIQCLLTVVVSNEECVFFLLNTSFEKATDKPI
jgi:hypothetical protein